MTIKKLKSILGDDGSDAWDNIEVCIVLSSSPTAPKKVASIKSASFGLDWCHGRLLLYPDKDMVLKHQPKAKKKA